LFALLATLPPEHSEQLHTCIRTLNHIYVVDRIFRANLCEERRPFDATNTKATPSLERLRADVEATDAWYRNYVSRLTVSGLSEVLAFTFTDGDRGRMSREEILLHVLTHGGYPFFLFIFATAPAQARPPMFLFLLMPVFYLVFGYISVALGCALYNFMYRYVGGVEFEARNESA
jgi:hypothetical protein